MILIISIILNLSFNLQASSNFEAFDSLENTADFNLLYSSLYKAEIALKKAQKDNLSQANWQGLWIPVEVIKRFRDKTSLLIENQRILENNGSNEASIQELKTVSNKLSTIERKIKEANYQLSNLGFAKAKHELFKENEHEPRYIPLEVQVIQNKMSEISKFIEQELKESFFIIRELNYITPDSSKNKKLLEELKFLHNTMLFRATFPSQLSTQLNSKKGLISFTLKKIESFLDKHLGFETSSHIPAYLLAELLIHDFDIHDKNTEKLNAQVRAQTLLEIYNDHVQSQPKEVRKSLRKIPSPPKFNSGFEESMYYLNFVFEDPYSLAYYLRSTEDINKFLEALAAKQKKAKPFMIEEVLEDMDTTGHRDSFSCLSLFQAR